jgi:hypothetical protein
MGKKTEIEIVIEILMKQLELLSERSNENILNNELCQLTDSLLETAVLITEVLDLNEEF